jgi:hypothetical protein
MLVGRNYLINKYAGLKELPNYLIKKYAGLKELPH